MPVSFSASEYGVLAAMIVFVLASLWLGALAQRALREGSFLQGYFLGNRGLGAWTVALTATVQSGGTFMGYPSLAYSFGWVVALWIAGYMVVPITGFGVLAKRLSQLSRRTGAITVPDLFRERFNSPAAGLISSLLIMFFMSFMMIAQFKAGATIMKVVVAPKTTAAAAAAATADAEAANEDPPKATAPAATVGFDRMFVIGLVVFTLIVVSYTMMGGFLAAVWTDLFQSVLMWVGVTILLVLSLWQVGDIETATRKAVANTGANFAMGPGYVKKPAARSEEQKSGWDLPSEPEADPRQFLTPGLAFSMFFVWVFAGIGSPASLVRLMACKDTQSIRRSVFLLGTYNAMIYIPLLIICVAARSILPEDLGKRSDEVIPQMALATTKGFWGGPLVAGLVLVAPFGAVMATVSSYLVVIASGLVRDVYQRGFRPRATQRELRWMTYAVMAGVGLLAVVANLRPVNYLQAIVVFCGESGAATFVVPAAMTVFWRRATAKGVIAGMLAGAGCSTLLLILGNKPTVETILGALHVSESFSALLLDAISQNTLLGPETQFRSFNVLGLGPVIWGLSASLIAGVIVSLLSRPPNQELVSKLFDAHPEQGNP